MIIWMMNPNVFHHRLDERVPCVLVFLLPDCIRVITKQLVQDRTQLCTVLYVPSQVLDHADETAERSDVDGLVHVGRVGHLRDRLLVLVRRLKSLLSAHMTQVLHLFSQNRHLARLEAVVPPSQLAQDTDHMHSVLRQRRAGHQQAIDHCKRLAPQRISQCAVDVPLELSRGINIPHDQTLVAEGSERSVKRHGLLHSF